jgi:hypothetical protein
VPPGDSVARPRQQYGADLDPHTVPHANSEYRNASTGKPAEAKTLKYTMDIDLGFGVYLIGTIIIVALLIIAAVINNVSDAIRAQTQWFYEDEKKEWDQQQVDENIRKIIRKKK